METDNGGWTLFMNYLHQPGSDIYLNQNRIPKDLKENSHMFLSNAGFTDRDIKELRFFCTERFKSSNKYWHFKTDNQEMIKVALTGDQSILTETSLSSAYVELPPTSGIASRYTRSVDKNQIGQYTFKGSDPKGGFTSRAFGALQYSSFWTIKGNDPNQDIYECGSSHETPFTRSKEESPVMVFTHHSVWFRGEAFPKEMARNRYLANVGL